MGYEASAEEIFLAALPLSERPRKGARALADAEGGTGHGGECNLTSAFQQEIVAAVIRLQPPQSKGDARLEGSVRLFGQCPSMARLVRTDEELPV